MGWRNGCADNVRKNGRGMLLTLARRLWHANLRIRVVLATAGVGYTCSDFRGGLGFGKRNRGSLRTGWKAEASSNEGQVSRVIVAKSVLPLIAAKDRSLEYSCKLSSLHILG